MWLAYYSKPFSCSEPPWDKIDQHFLLTQQMELFAAYFLLVSSREFVRVNYILSNLHLSGHCDIPIWLHATATNQIYIFNPISRWEQTAKPQDDKRIIAVTSRITWLSFKILSWLRESKLNKLRQTEYLSRSMQRKVLTFPDKVGSLEKGRPSVSQPRITAIAPVRLPLCVFWTWKLPKICSLPIGNFRICQTLIPSP